MAEIVIMGELLVEIMRPKEDIPLYQSDYFRGPFPSGAPGIFISTAARLGHSTAIISGVGNDDFGENIMRRLKHDGVDVSRVIIPEDGHTGIAFVTYFADGERKFLFYMDNSPCIKAKAPESMSGFEDTKYMHIMGCSLMADVNFAKEIMKFMNMLKSHGVKISFDPNVRLEMLKDNAVLDMYREELDNAEEDYNRKRYAVKHPNRFPDKTYKELTEEFYNMLYDIKSKEPFELIDYLNWDGVDNDDFADAIHLNISGAKKLSTAINKYIMEKFEK